MPNQNQPIIFFRLGFIALLFIVAAAYFSQGCAVSVEPAGSGAAACYTATPEAGGDPSMCGIAGAGPYSSAGDVQIIMQCDRPAANPWPAATTCTPTSFQNGAVWCCMPKPSCSAEEPGLWQFAHAADKPGVPSSCVDLGGGRFQCAPDACLLLPYFGTCPVCQ
jgi:hypothetical protein